MKIIIFLLTVAVTTAKDEMSEYHESNMNFAADVYKELSKTKDGNFMASPLSAQIILSLVTVGARDNTALQLATGLHLPSADARKIEDTFNRLSSSFVTVTPYQFITVNKIFTGEQYHIKNEYKSTAINIFKSDIENINFFEREKTRQSINKWVEEKTNNKVKELIKQNTLSSDTVALLVNTLYFHGHWVHEFGENMNNEQQFYISKTQTVPFIGMTQRNYFNYYYNQDLNAEFLELPFVGDDVTMTFVLPKEKDGILGLEKKISKVLTVQPLHKVDASITIAKFKMESEIDVKKILKSLGVTEPFIPSANFNGISNTPLYIDEVVQKTFIEINEKGATAASATGITMIPVSMPAVFFITDHPFIYFLRHKINGVFFVGRFAKPDNIP